MCRKSVKFFDMVKFEVSLQETAIKLLEKYMHWHNMDILTSELITSYKYSYFKDLEQLNELKLDVKLYRWQADKMYKMYLKYKDHIRNLQMIRYKFFPEKSIDFFNKVNKILEGDE